MTDFAAGLIAFAQVVLIDVSLAGDNAVVVGLAVAGLGPGQRLHAILFGVGMATLLRILLALVALRLLAVIGLTLAGGLLLLWVCWHMFRELRGRPAHHLGQANGKTLLQAVVQIALADLSMSLDNVLAVAGAAHEHPRVLVAGLVLSVVLMGAAAGVLARLLERQRWIAWLGLLIVLYVAGGMIWHGGWQVWRHATPPHMGG
ncbi:MAG: YjbE family putative metal transport protein [Janthinobacterium lividum]